MLEHGFLGERPRTSSEEAAKVVGPSREVMMNDANEGELSDADQSPAPDNRVTSRLSGLPQKLLPVERNPFDVIWGQWPGDETDEEFLALLERME